MPAIVSRFIETIRDGFRLFWLAPAIIALVAIPEFVQHIAEIQIGMFESREAFRAMSDDPRRLVWGVLKIAGLLLAILAAIRFWGTRNRAERWWDLRGIAWKNLVVALALLALVGIPGELLKPVIGELGGNVLGIVLSILTLPLLVLLAAGLIGNKAVGLTRVFKFGWLAAICMIVFAAIVWIPLQWLHGANHDWAMGAADPLVWALMVFDALVVGAIAALAGTALFQGYTLFGETAS